MRKLICVIAILSVFAISCQKNSQSNGTEHGSVNFTATIELSIDETTKSKPMIQLPPEVIPADNKFMLDITGSYIHSETGAPTDYIRNYPSFDHYNSPDVAAGDYKAVASSGDIELEGVNLAVFMGEANYTIIPSRTISETITIGLINSVIDIEFKQYFNKYFHDAVFSIRTASENKFEFTQTPSGDWIFIKPNTDIFLSGHATKQNGTVVDFPEQKVAVSQAQTKHTITMDASKAGEMTITFELDNTLISADPINIELNPDMRK